MQKKAIKILTAGEIDMAQTEAQLRASKKYHQKFDNVQFRVPKGDRARIADHASLHGESLNAFLYRAVTETIARDQQQE